MVLLYHPDSVLIRTDVIYGATRSWCNKFLWEPPQRGFSHQMRFTSQACSAISSVSKLPLASFHLRHLDRFCRVAPKHNRGVQHFHAGARIVEAQDAAGTPVEPSQVVCPRLAHSHGMT